MHKPATVMVSACLRASAVHFMGEHIVDVQMRVSSCRFKWPSGMSHHWLIMVKVPLPDGSIFEDIYAMPMLEAILPLTLVRCACTMTSHC